MWRDTLQSMMPARWRNDDVVVPVVRVSGVIGTTARFRPGISMESMAGPLQRAFSYRNSPAVALIVNSPGGTPVQAHLIYKRIRSLAAEKQKTVFAFVEDVAASGGYMIAAAADEIIVDPSSIVGSIGVVSAGFGFQDLIARYGIERRVHSAGEKKVMLDPFKPERAEDVAHLESLQREIHALFIDLVKERRGAKLTNDPDLFSGAFWSGRRGVELGLADRVGDARTVLREIYGDKVSTPIVGARRSFWARFGIPSSLAGDSANAIIGAIEERAAWSRFGL
jgi:signal peptide peptidase SppA